MLLGPGSLQQRKVEHGASLTVLGLRLPVLPTALRISIDAAKRKQWLAMLQMAIDKATLSAGSAGKLAGKLGFGGQFEFGQTENV